MKVEAEKLGTVTILHFEGRIVNGVAITNLRESVFNQAGANTLILDFAHVDLIDAGGLGALLDLREWTQLMGIELKLMNVIRRVRQVFEITRLDSVFDITSEHMSVRYGTKKTPLPLSWVYLLLLLFVPALPIVTSNANAETQRNRTSRKLSGIWLLNVEQSANGQSELPGNLDSPNRSSLIRAADLWTYVESEPIVAELLEASELLEILLDGKEITMNAAGSPDVVITRTVYTDGRSNEQSFGTGNLAISRARWDDDKLIIETDTTAALHVTETYELNADASSLTVSGRIENPLWDQSLLLHRVYDRVR